jgi:phosphoserine phosphatase RsbU/P
MTHALQVPLFTPRSAPAPATDVHAVSLPARTFTGDFWFTHRAGDHLWFALGDVAGKGLPAAVVMAMIQEELEHRIASCARAGCDPSTTVTRLHAFLRPLLPRNRFTTAVVGWLRDDGLLKIVNAGHCAPLVMRADGRVERIDSTGPVVGVLPKSQWRAATLTLGFGDRLVLYSDGVIEALDGDAEFGICGLERAIPRDALSSREVAAAIVAAMPPRQDDVTLLVIGR